MIAETPGTTSTEIPALTHAPASSASPVNDAGIAVHEPHDGTSPPGRLDDQLRPGGVRQRLPVLAQGAVDDLGLGGAPRSDVVGPHELVGQDHLRIAQEVGGPQGEQAEVTGTGADESHRAQLLTLAGVTSGQGTRSPITSEAPSASRSAARRRPMTSASPRLPVVDSRTEVEPSTDTTTPRR